MAAPFGPLRADAVAESTVMALGPLTSTWNDSKPLRAWQIAAVDPPLWGADGRICASESNTSIRPPAPKDRSPAPVGEQAGAEAVVPLGVAGAGDSARGR